MRKVKEILRLRHACGLSERQIAESCNLSKGSVSNYLRRAEAANLSWPLPEAVDDTALEAKLFAAKARAARPEPDWEQVHKERQRKGVTLLLLWQEYKAQHPTGYEYAAFTIHYRRWLGEQGVTMRQVHAAGEKLFVDYAGMTLVITDPGSGEMRQGQVFVAVLGASNYTYAEVTESQSGEDWLSSHRRALEFFGGVPKVVVPDNLKAGVKKPCRYEPELNPAYAEFAEHYGLAVVPARVRKPRDKAKAEVGVQIVERSILARLRDRSFFSLREANEAVWELLAELNAKPFQKLSGSRQSAFVELERALLQPLPGEPYNVASWKKAKVNIDYHVEVLGHYYSVPYQHARQEVEVRLGELSVEVFQQGKRIASHVRVVDTPRNKGRHTTVVEHMPAAHQRHAEWSPARLISWAEKTGEHTALVVTHILESRPHPEQGFRSCLGIMRLGKLYGDTRLESACCRAHRLRSYSYKSVQSILKHGLDAQPLELEPQLDTPTTQSEHRNVRGAAYYRQEADPC